MSKRALMLCAVVALAAASTAPAFAQGMAEPMSAPVVQAVTPAVPAAPAGCGLELGLADRATAVGAICPAVTPGTPEPIFMAKPRLRTCVCSCGYPCTTNADCGPGGVCGPGITCC